MHRIRVRKRVKLKKFVDRNAYNDNAMNKYNMRLMQHILQYSYAVCSMCVFCFKSILNIFIH